MFKSCFDLASVALFDLLVSARERRAACHVASNQDEDVDAEEDVGHGSLPVVIRRIEPVQNRACDQDHSDQGEQDLADEEEGVHGSRLGAALGALGLCIALHDQLAQLEGCVGCVGNLAGLPAREPGLRNASTAEDFALRELVLQPEAHQKTAGFALLSAHEEQSYAMSPSLAMPDRIIFLCIVRA